MSTGRAPAETRTEKELREAALPVAASPSSPPVGLGPHTARQSVEKVPPRRAFSFEREGSKMSGLHGDPAQN